MDGPGRHGEQDRVQGRGQSLYTLGRSTGRVLCSGCCKYYRLQEYRMLTRVDSAGNSIVVVTWGDLCKPLIQHNLLGIEYRG